MKRILVFGVDPFHPYKSKDITRYVFYNRYGGNTGNLLFGRAVAQYLKREDTELTFGLYDLFKDDFQKSINDQFDHLVLPLANHIGPHLTDELTLLTKLVQSANMPVTVIGIGAQSTFDFEFDFLRGTEQIVKDFFAAVLEKSASIGVRGRFTAEVLYKLGFKSGIRIIGCPSFYLSGSEINLTHKMKGETPQVVFNYSPEAWRVYQALSLSLLKPANFITQYLPDYSTIDSPTLEVIHSSRMHLFGDYDSWRTFCGEHDFTISSRIHGSLLSIAAGTPAFLLANDSRTREMAEFFSIPFANPDSLNSDVTVEDLLERSDLSTLNQTYKQKFIDFKRFLDENDLIHNLSGADVGAYSIPVTPFDTTARLNLSLSSAVLGLLSRIENCEIENKRLQSELLKKTSPAEILKRGLGTKLGPNRIKAIKELFRVK